MGAKMTEYFNDIGNIVLLSHEEEIELVSTVKRAAAINLSLQIYVLLFPLLKITQKKAFLLKT